MNGKDLAIALAGAALVGGAAGAAASLLLVPKADTAPAAVPPDVLYRLKTAEDALAKTKTALEDSRKAVNELSERVAASEIKSAKAAAGGPAGPFASSARAARIGRHHADGTDPRAADGVAAGEPVEIAGLDDDMKVQLENALSGIGEQLGGVSGDLAGLQSGLELRKLPEADRWQKAKDDLGLTWNQVEDLKKAVLDRDTAMKDAMTTEKKTNASGGAVTIKRSDAGKAAHAEADYHDRVNATLDESQRKNWSSKGYDHAFGSSPFGGSGATMVMSIDMSSDKKDAAPAK
jgi:hypothetical protein